MTMSVHQLEQRKEAKHPRQGAMAGRKKSEVEVSVSGDFQRCSDARGASASSWWL
jgi:hypothetical protein